MLVKIQEVSEKEMWRNDLNDLKKKIDFKLN
jgi:hypothetical protein